MSYSMDDLNDLVMSQHKHESDLVNWERGSRVYDNTSYHELSDTPNMPSDIGIISTIYLKTWSK